MLAFTVGVSAVSALVCGLAPGIGLRSSATSLTDSLKAGGRESSTAPRRRVRSLLVVLEAASAVVLLIGAGLLVRSFIQVIRVPLGFSPEGR